MILKLSEVSSLVEQSTIYPKIAGSTPAAANTGREESCAKKLFFKVFDIIYRHIFTFVINDRNKLVRFMYYWRFHPTLP